MTTEQPPRAKSLAAKIREQADNEELETQAGRLATILTASPNLRARLFANPTKRVGRSLPPRKFWDYGIDPYWSWRRPGRFFVERHVRRALLAERVLENIAERIDERKLSASVNTDAVFEDFFAPVVRVSQRSFNGVFVLSFLVFLVGSGLIGAGVYLAIYPPVGGNSTVLGSVFGGSGAIGALGSVFAMTIRGIRDAGGDRAKMQLVLTGFATELGQLRAYAENPPDESTSTPARSFEDIRLTNREILDAMKAAVGLIPSDGEVSLQTSGTARSGDEGGSQNANQ